MSLTDKILSDGGEGNPVGGPKYDYDKEIANYVRIIRTMRHALEQIRDEDYRGSHHNSHFIAKRALLETE